MKKNFFKKLLCCAMLGFGVIALTGCQSTNQYAGVDPASKVSIVVKQEGINLRKYAQFSIGVVNPSIYDATAYHVEYDLFDNTGKQFKTLTYDFENIYVRHGTYYYFIDEIEIVDPELKAKTADVKININNSQATAFRNVWETYMPWWIITIVVLAFALIFFCADIFRKGQSVQDIKDMLAEHIGSTLTVAALILLICLIPLMFSSWVVTVILAGGLGAYIILSTLITLIYSKTLENK